MEGNKLLTRFSFLGVITAGVDLVSNYKVFVKGHVLFFQMIGTMDLVAAKEYYLKVKTLLPELGDKWASLVDLRHWGLHTPKIVEQMVGFHHWVEKNGHKVEVCITGGSNLKVMARKKLLEQSHTSLNIVYVDTEEEGWTWLSDNGYVDIE